VLESPLFCQILLTGWELKGATLFFWTAHSQGKSANPLPGQCFWGMSLLDTLN
jgi:hypothetical protein